MIASFSFWFVVVTSVLYSLLLLCLMEPLTTLCGSTPEIYSYVREYLMWTIVLGGPGTVLSQLLANVVRGEGHAGVASFGISLGGALNIVLDPLFILPQFLNMGSGGAGLATGISNLISALYLMGFVLFSRDTLASLKSSYLKHTRTFIRDILRIGLPSALQHLLTVVSISALTKFVSLYNTEAIAALGIQKKLDMFPLYCSLGVATGLLPLLAYNYSSGNQKRRKDAFRFGCTISVSFAVLCVILFYAFAPKLCSFFIKDPVTLDYAADFLKIQVLAQPLVAINYPMIIQFQAMGQVKESLICSVLRKGILDIPFLFLMNALLPLYGCMWVQLIVDTISLIVALYLNYRINHRTPLSVTT